MEETQNEQGFEYVDDVPVFVEHEARDGYEAYDKERLAKLVVINNQRINAGEPPVLIVGHTDGSDDEKPVIGFVSKFKQGMRNGLSTVFAQFKVYADQIGEIKKFPKRSIELWNDEAVSAIALLGGNRPELDLGIRYGKGPKMLMQFSADKRKMKMSSLNNNTQDKTGSEMEVTEDLKAAILEVLSETDVFAFVKQLMDEKKEPVDEEPAGDEAEPEKNSADEQPKEDDKPKDEAEGDKADDEEPSEEKKKYSRMAQELSEVKAMYRKSEREKALIGLQAEGYMFDLKEELADAGDMEDKHFQKHVGRIMRFSKKAPLHKKFDVAPITIGGGEHQPSKDELEAVKQFAIENNMPFGKALTQFKK